MPGLREPMTTGALTVPGAAALPRTLNGGPILTPPLSGDAALELRDQALAELDAGNPTDALVLARRGLAGLTAAGSGGGLDAVALLVALAEIEEALDRFGDAAATTAAAIALLGEDIGPGHTLGGEPGPGHADGDSLMLWCQAQERMAGLERLSGAFTAAAARLTSVLDFAVAAFGETSRAVVSAANALGVVHKYAGDFGAAEAAYRRAMAAVEGLADPDPLTKAGLLHNLGGLAHSRGDAATGIPLAEQGLALRVGVLGNTHPDVARDLNALGALYHLAGRHADAGHAYLRALAVFETFCGPEHFEVGMTYANLAVLHEDQGYFATAEDLGRRSLRILETVLGPRDAEVGLTLLNLATAVAAQGRLAEAADLAARAAAILTDRLPTDHPHVRVACETVNQLRSMS